LNTDRVTCDYCGKTVNTSSTWQEWKRDRQYFLCAFNCYADWIVEGRPERKRKYEMELTDEEYARVLSVLPVTPPAWTGGDKMPPPPPWDDLLSTGWERCPWIPDANLRVRLTLTEPDPPGTGEDGAHHLDIRWVEGRRVLARMVPMLPWPEILPGEPGSEFSFIPDIEVSLTFQNYLRLRSGVLSPLEAIEAGGDVSTVRWTVLLMLHGLLQDETYRELWGALPRYC
jgi:hypothetical protein